jgi:sugar lactone lactonase YvrE
MQMSAESQTSTKRSSRSRSKATNRLTQLLCIVGGLSWQMTGMTAEPPQYQIDPSWPKPLPNDWMMGQAAGVAVDKQDHIWVIQRPATACQPSTETEKKQSAKKECKAAPPVMEFDQTGNLLRAWGGASEDYQWPGREHGITIDTKGFVWIGGNGPIDGQYLKFTPEGKFILQIGKSGTLTDSNDVTRLGQPADADIDIDANEVYIADGYHNHRVIVFDSESGAYKRHWGAYGNRPKDADLRQYNPTASQFANPVHCVRIAKDGLVYVCDRANNRIQVFQKNGTFIKEFIVEKGTRSSGSTWDLDFWIDPQQSLLFHADGSNSRVSTLKRENGAAIARFGSSGSSPGEFHRLHNLAVDSAGNIYTTEVDTGNRAQKFRLVQE